MSSEPGVPAIAMPPIPDRPIKIVLTLRRGRQENEPGGALVAVGLEGREPALRYLDSGDLAAVLAVIPEIVAATIASWRRRQAPGSVRTGPAPVGEPSVASTTAPVTAARAQPTPQSRRARGGESSAGQPSLFG